MYKAVWWNVWPLHGKSDAVERDAQKHAVVKPRMRDKLMTELAKPKTFHSVECLASDYQVSD